MLMVMTNWTGLSAADVDTVAGAINDLNQLPQVTDKIQQAVINAIVELRFARGALANDPHLQPHGQNVIDPDHAYYYGISLGGIMGDTFMAYDPDVLNGVLNVPGGCWSLLLQRSIDWAPLADVFQAAYTDGVNQMVLSSYLQSLFDYAESHHHRALRAQRAPAGRAHQAPADADGALRHAGLQPGHGDDRAHAGHPPAAPHR